MNYKIILIICIVILVYIYLVPKGWGAEKTSQEKDENLNGLNQNQQKINFDEVQKGSYKTKLQALKKIIDYRLRQEDALLKARNDKNKTGHQNRAFMLQKKAEAHEMYLNRNYNQLKGINLI